MFPTSRIGIIHRTTWFSASIVRIRRNISDEFTTELDRLLGAVLENDNERQTIGLQTEFKPADSVECFGRRR